MNNEKNRKRALQLFFVTFTILTLLFPATSWSGDEVLDLVHKPEAKFKAGEPFILKALVMKAHNLNKLIALLRTDSTDQYRSLELKFDSQNGDYRFILPVEETTHLTYLEYYIAGIDHSGKSHILFATADQPHRINEEQALELDAVFDDMLADEFSVYCADDLVITASRYKQSIQDVPVAMSVINRADIVTSASTFIPELFRTLPGIEVFSPVRSDVNVSARGFNQLMSNKMLVMVDNRSVYQDFFGAVEWGALSIGIDDIERIEIIRSPGSTQYGANAFSGVINIITREPDGSSEYNFHYGTQGEFVGSAITSGIHDKFKYRLSVGFEQYDMWGNDFNKPDPHTLSNSISVLDFNKYQLEWTYPKHAMQVLRFNSTFKYNVTDDDLLTLTAGMNDGYSQIFTNEVIGLYLREGLFSNVGLKYEHAPFIAKVYWNMLDNEHRNFMPGMTKPLYSSVYSNVIDSEIQSQYSFKALGQHNFMYGLNYRVKDIYFNLLKEEKYTEHHVALFLSEEYRPFEELAFTAGYRLDRHPVIDFTHSFRASMNIAFDSASTLRFAASTAFRAPTFIESYIDFDMENYVVAGNGYPVKKEQEGVYSQGFKGSKNINPENIKSIEAGYLYYKDEFKINFDIFYSWIDDLITAQFAQNEAFMMGTSTKIGDVIFKNMGKLTSMGGELTFKYRPNEKFSATANYSYVVLKDNYDYLASEQMYYNGVPTVDLLDAEGNSLGVITQENIVQTEGSPEHKINLGIKLGHDCKNGVFGVDLHYSSGSKWNYMGAFENQFTPQVEQSGGMLAFIPMNYSKSVDPYMLLNMKFIYWVIENELHVGISGYNLLFTDFKEHWMGSETGTTLMGHILWRVPSQ